MHRALLGARIDDFGRRQADAVIDDIHAGIARPDRDLLGPVRMAVEARLADQKFHPPPELQRHALDLVAQRIEIVGALARHRRDAGRRPIFAESIAQRRAPFAGRHPRFGGGDRRLHDVAPFLGGGAQRRKAAATALASRAARQAASAGDLLGLDMFGHDHDGVGCRWPAARLRSRGIC